jgi:hypothetical protein
VCGCGERIFDTLSLFGGKVRVFNIFRVWADLKKFFQFINGDADFFYNIIQSAFFYFFVIGDNDRNIPLQVMHEYMASSLMVYNKTNSSEGLD